MKKLILLIFALIALAVVIALVAVKAGGGAGPSIAEDTVLRLRLSTPLLDYLPAPDVPFLRQSESQSLIDIYRSLRRARTDDDVDALVVEIHHASFSLAQAEELRRQILAVAEAGKTVECYLETAGEGTNGTLAYFVASACPRLTLAPQGELNVVGLYADSAFFRGSLDKLKIEPEFISAGDYKSFSESYTLTEHSAAAREALSSVLDDLFLEIIGAIATGRDLDPSRVRQLIDAAPYTAAEALDLGLVDALGYPDEFESALADTLGTADSWLDLPLYTPRGPGLGGRRVAIAFAQGTIVRGYGGIDAWSQQMLIGSTDFGAVLRELAGDDSIAAVVLRVDSPGGSALASDLLLREVEQLAAVKPVIVSMSSVAASGGYYISAKAEHIVAEATTITGSIGVVAGRLLTRQFQQELLGISHDVLRRGANADFFSSLDGWRPAQRERFQELIQGVYDTFVGHVAEGRELTPEAAEDVAQGRVWTGTTARDLGLVDQLGGFDAAIDAAAAAAGIEPEEVRLALYPKPPTLLDLLSGAPGPGFSLAALLEALVPLRSPLYSLEIAPHLAAAARPE